MRSMVTNQLDLCTDIYIINLIKDRYVLHGSGIIMNKT